MFNLHIFLGKQTEPALIKSNRILNLKVDNKSKTRIRDDEWTIELTIVVSTD